MCFSKDNLARGVAEDTRDHKMHITPKNETNKIDRSL